MDLQPHDHPTGLFDRLAAENSSARVTVHLRGGGSLSGFIGPTGNESVVLKQLAGKDFFDAYVRYDAVDCVEVQTRS